MYNIIIKYLQISFTYLTKYGNITIMTKRKINSISFFVSLLIIVLLLHIQNNLFSYKKTKIQFEIYNKSLLCEKQVGDILEYNGDEFIVVENTIIKKECIKEYINKYKIHDLFIVLSDVEKMSNNCRIIITIKK